MKTLGEAQGAGPFFGKSWEKGGENLEKLLEKGRTSFSCLRNLLDYGMFFAGTPPIFHGKNTVVTVFLIFPNKTNTMRNGGRSTFFVFGKMWNINCLDQRHLSVSNFSEEHVEKFNFVGENLRRYFLFFCERWGNLHSLPWSMPSEIPSGMAGTSDISLVGGDWNHGILWLPIQLGISSSQLTNTPSFFRGVGWNHQADILDYLHLPIHHM